MIEMHGIYVVSSADATDRVFFALIRSVMTEAPEAEPIVDGMLFSQCEVKFLECVALQN